MTVLATDGGPHSAAKWASATAGMLVLSDQIEDGPRKNAALRLQATIADLLVPHHQGVHDAERAGLKAIGSDHLLTPFDADDHAPATLATVVGAAKGTEWEAHFADPTVQAIITDTISNHFNTSAMIERLWHADRNPDCPIASAFMAQHHNETVVPSDEPEAEPAD